MDEHELSESCVIDWPFLLIRRTRSAEMFRSLYGGERRREYSGMAESSHVLSLEGPHLLKLGGATKKSNGMAVVESEKELRSVLDGL